MTGLHLQAISADREDRTCPPVTDHQTTTEQLIDHDPALLVPEAITVAWGLELEHARRLVRVAQTLYTVWDTGQFHHLVGVHLDSQATHAACPTRSVRAAVPDLRCTIEHLAVEASRFGARLHFTGHFTGTHRGIHGIGSVLDTTAYDVQAVPPRAVRSATAPATRAPTERGWERRLAIAR